MVSSFHLTRSARLCLAHQRHRDGKSEPEPDQDQVRIVRIRNPSPIFVRLALSVSVPLRPLWLVREGGRARTLRWIPNEVMKDEP
jgi:hypothetical protein